MTMPKLMGLYTFRKASMIPRPVRRPQSNVLPKRFAYIDDPPRYPDGDGSRHSTADSMKVDPEASMLEEP